MEHNIGKEKNTTANYKPYKLIFLTIVEDRTTARITEKYLKGGSGKEFLKTL